MAKGMKFFPIDKTRSIVEVDELYSVQVIKTDEGLVVDVYPISNDKYVEPVASTWVMDNDVLTDGPPY